MIHTWSIQLRRTHLLHTQMLSNVIHNCALIMYVIPKSIGSFGAAKQSKVDGLPSEGRIKCAQQLFYRTIALEKNASPMLHNILPRYAVPIRELNVWKIDVKLNNA